MYLHVYMLVDMSAGTLRDLERVWDSRREPELQVLVLGTELRSFAKAVYILNHCVFL